MHSCIPYEPRGAITRHSLTFFYCLLRWLKTCSVKFRILYFLCPLTKWMCSGVCIHFLFVNSSAPMTTYRICTRLLVNVNGLMFNHVSQTSISSQSSVLSWLPWWLPKNELEHNIKGLSALSHPNTISPPRRTSVTESALFLFSTDVMRSCSGWLEARSSVRIFPGEQHVISRRDEPWKGIRPRRLDRAHSTQRGKRLSECPDGKRFIGERKIESRQCCSVPSFMFKTSLCRLHFE